MTQPPLPEPNLDPQPITSEQYFAYTPEKLELSKGFYEYGGQDFTGFYLAILTNMGLREAIRQVPLSLWVKAIQELAAGNPKLSFENETTEAMLTSFHRGIDRLANVASYLEESEEYLEDLKQSLD
ncbi:hypothetical protein [Roseofilum casamattae]|uniref:Uncharacterized protein n=1 Tax=Roseofilum casamattae BLCC-M143 TaxID=3022442 RepID=A0ABT7BVB1_9CYAN|nr:hypothetical protein [Roseofilum casamattae]MDJ1182391.1 hypothetical protein [Roseofilum casamattae BLCC-M143]